MTQTQQTCEDGIVNTKGDTINVPEQFICPITMQVMASPVMTRIGLNFERSAIIEWLQNGSDTCPCTRKPMTMLDLLPNRRLQAEIVSWRTANDIPETVDENGTSIVLIVPVTQKQQDKVTKRAASTAPQQPVSEVPPREPSRPRGFAQRIRLVAKRR